MQHVTILGILNLTRDSFSDGGRYLSPADAIAHAERLREDGADVIDVGAESTHPDADDVPASEEIARLEAVVPELRRRGLRVSVDTHKPSVMARADAWGVEFLNDVNALRDPAAVTAARCGSARIILMHSRSIRPRAERGQPPPDRTHAPSPDAGRGAIVPKILEFFRERVALLEAAGLARERLIVDPGMGFFLGPDAGDSLDVLRQFAALREMGRPLLISVSRKSFVGQVLAEGGAPRPVHHRAAGTLAAELWAAQHGAEYVRTHEPRPLRDGLRMLDAIARGAP